MSEDKNKQNQEFEPMDVVVIETEDGEELYYTEDVVIEHEGKSFAILIGLPHDCDCGDANHNHDEVEIIIARIDIENGEEVYLAPTEEEFDAVRALYEQSLDD